MVSANIQMAASLSTVKSVADVSGTSKGSNVLGKYRWLQPPVLVGTCPALSHYFSSTGKRQLDLTSKKHCGSASQMMWLASVPYFPWSILSVVQVLPERWVLWQMWKGSSSFNSCCDEEGVGILINYSSSGLGCACAPGSWGCYLLSYCSAVRCLQCSTLEVLFFCYKCRGDFVLLLRQHWSCACYRTWSQ